MKLQDEKTYLQLNSDISVYKEHNLFAQVCNI